MGQRKRGAILNRRLGHLSEDLKEVREGAMRITEKEPSRNGSSQFKDPEARACLEAQRVSLW